jgi:hypothetical protein
VQYREIIEFLERIYAKVATPLCPSLRHTDALASIRKKIRHAITDVKASRCDYDADIHSWADYWNPSSPSWAAR